VPELDRRFPSPSPGTNSRGLPVVEAEQTPEPIAADHFPGAANGLVGRDQRIVEPLMVPFLVVVLHEFADLTCPPKLIHSGCESQG